jgi:hypothetical protein
MAGVVALVSAGGGAREVEAQVDAQAREWALFVFATSEELKWTSSRMVQAAELTPGGA